jgi:multidrug efflux pump subunit AcrA (membrane-fusion protein)
MQSAGMASYIDSNGGNLRFDSQNQQFQLTAPIDGIVSDVTILPGQSVDQRQKLFSIFDPSYVWLRMEVFLSQIKNIDTISAISVFIPGQEEPIHIQKNALKLISRAEIIDPKNQTASLWIEVANTNRQLMIGQSFTAKLYSDRSTEYLTIPVSAVFESNNRKSVYVHTSGESFEEREVMAGPEYLDYVAIKSGIQSGERVVTRGGYQLKLASTTEEIGHPHTH